MKNQRQKKSIAVIPLEACNLTQIKTRYRCFSCNFQNKTCAQLLLRRVYKGLLLIVFIQGKLRAC